MAEAADIAVLRQRVGMDGFTDTELGEMLDRYVNMDLTTAEVWEIRAGRYHGLVNISESGSSRNMGDLYKNAIAMAAYYRKKYDDSILDPGETVVGPRTRTGQIVRP